uniref:Uncharacterized protein n=1 Tax=Rhizophora mucronata TaxID=61149 RepID=A0A2P2PA05_RHIMU
MNQETKDQALQATSIILLPSMVKRVKII